MEALAVSRELREEIFNFKSYYSHLVESVVGHMSRLRKISCGLHFNKAI